MRSCGNEVRRSKVTPVDHCPVSFLPSLSWTAALAILLACVAPGADTLRADENPPKAAEKKGEEATAESERDQYFEMMRVFVETFEQIDKNYVKEIDRKALIEAAVRGMLTKLDPYSDYISSEDREKFAEAVEQEFGGVGIQVNFDRAKHEIEVISPLPGTPAYNAGIVAGDRIVEIDGKKIREFDDNQEVNLAVKMLRGQEGTKVTVGVRRGASENVDQITMTRQIIQLDTVLGDSRNADKTWKFMLDDEKKIGYLRLTHFTRRSGAEIKSALRKLKEQNMQALVLDLRFNPGGYLDAAIDVADLFIEEGKIVSTSGRNTKEHVWNAKKSGTFSGFPMAVLVNHFSASASEIVSACLQDHQRAIVVGERSWGKGSVQTVSELEEGKAALKLTTASYHRPSGKNIHRFPDSKDTDEWGVSPDAGFDLKLSFDDTVKLHRSRQQRDALVPQDPPLAPFEDLQLKKAMDYVKEKLAAPAKPADKAA